MSVLEIRSVQPEEYPRLAELVAGAFSQGSAATRQSIIDRFGRAHRTPHFTYDRHLVGVVDGEIAAHLIIFPLTVAYDFAFLPAGGIGAVCTHPDHRGRGYAEALLRAAIDRMTAQGMALSLLNGIPNYYNRVGFTHVIPHYTVEIDRAAARALDPGPLRLRPLEAGDESALAHLFEDTWSGRPAPIRAPETWDWRVNHEPPTFAQVVTDAAGTVRGYVAGSGPNSFPLEVVAADPDAARALLCALATHEHDAPLTWTMPPDDPFVGWARSWLPVRVATQYNFNSGWMGRIIDPARFAGALLPAIGARLGVGSAALRIDEATTRLEAPGLESITLDNGDLLRILFGAYPPDVPDETLWRLLPDRLGMIAPWDWF